MVGVIDKEKYSALLTDILPRRIETEEENERYLEIVESFMDKGGENLSPEEVSLFNLLVTLIEDFEQRNYPMPDIPPNERIKYLLQEKQLRQKDLLPIFGSEGIISEVLKGTRGITVRHAKELARFFNVPVELFI
ncbi:MAG TPA: hypothetical protein VK400_08030 [Pyrinomonadaceae bacterium]|nr:hypothetical protein [Pyrinomonadaceae bacterium]